LDFTPVQFATARETAHSGVPRRTRAYSNALGERRNFPLAKVGVEGSNPFARSKCPNHRKCLKAEVSVGFGARAPGCAAGASRGVRKARGCPRVAGLAGGAQLKSWCPGSPPECNGFRVPMA